MIGAIQHVVRLAVVGALLVACGNDVTIVEQRPELMVTPNVADVGTVAVGQAVTVDLLLHALSNMDVPILSIDVMNIEGDWFSFDGAVSEVPGDQSASLTLNYQPYEAGYHLAKVTVHSDSEDGSIEVFVRGSAKEAILSVWPRVLDFGMVAIGESKESQVEIINQGGVAMDIAEIAFSAEGFTAGTFQPHLEPGAQVTVPVVYTGIDEGPLNASMMVDMGVVGVLPDVMLRANDCQFGSPAAYDEDGDGVTSCSGDCNDDDASVHPGAEETIDDTDEDCNGLVDDGTDAYDDDGDGYSENDGDCNDGDEEVHPGATEDPLNGRDDDCDGVTDLGALDGDEDGYSGAGGDCDEMDGTIYPGAPELADGKDNDCDGDTDEGTVLYDDDGDGLSESEGDCDDSDDSVYAGAEELADWIDNDCDGTIDEGTFNYDDDGDGYSELGGDCDDDNDAISPAEREVTGDGVDNDCDDIAE